MNAGNAAWMLTSASFVLLMTPGLAFFYGGMTRSKSVLNMMMMSFGALGVVTVVYLLWGFSMSYGTDSVGGFFASPFEWFGLDEVGQYADLGDFAYIMVAFQLTFAIITVALISGAIADRAKFSTWLVFSGIWVTLAYFPLAHMVWGGGFLDSEDANGLAARLFGYVDGLAKVGPVDFAGGTVVHINAGTAGLVLALVIGTRRGFGNEAIRPHNLPFTMLGAGLLWFGWFGFNAGSELAADGTAGLVWVNTTAATATAMLGWMLVERIRDGHATSLGAASGVVAGLVAITPACGALSPVGSLLLGLVAGGLCAVAVGLKYRFGYDDSLDVVGVHLVGGLVGTVGIGFLSTETGLLYGNDARQLVVQGMVALLAMAFSAIVTLAVASGLHVTMGWRIDEDDEVTGIDQVTHAETAYDLHQSFGARTTSAVPVTHPAAPTKERVDA